MADLLYPTGLPGPQMPWRQKRVERRQLRTLREPANFNVVRWRDVPVIAQAQYLYNEAEMAIWAPWRTGALATQAARHRYWTAPLPGRGGVINRVARYLVAPQCTYLGEGIWRVNVPLYVRGASVAPQQDATAAGDPGGEVLREDGTAVLREDGSSVLRG